MDTPESSWHYEMNQASLGSNVDTETKDSDHKNQSPELEEKKNYMEEETKLNNSITINSFVEGGAENRISDNPVEEDDSTSVKKNILAHTVEDLEEDLACSVCLHLAVQPTTLVCGHTSCRVCLAKWYFTSEKKVCPMCRQEYQGLPMTNIQLRKMIHKLYPDKAKDREEEFEADTDAKNLVAKYDKELQESRSGKSDTDMASFCAGIVIALSSFFVVYLAWYWQSSDTNLLVLKPVQTWKPKDVSQWLSELSWASDYSHAALNNHIDGNMLMSITEEDLVSYLNITNQVHQRALLFAVELLQDEGIKMPANIWEYKAIYPGRSLFLVYGMKDFPRTSLLYMWVYFYDDLFLPLVKLTTGNHSTEPQQGHLQKEDISIFEWATFFMYALLAPEGLVIVIALQMFSHHFFSPIFAIATGILYQILEYLAWFTLFKNVSFRSLVNFGRQHGKQLLSAFIFMAVWPIVPQLLCDVFFYGALYISPVQASMALYQKVAAARNQ